MKSIICAFLGLLIVGNAWHIQQLSTAELDASLNPKAVPQASGWTTNRNEIKDPSGQSVILKSVAWFGFETANYVVHGIWTRKM